MSQDFLDIQYIIFYVDLPIVWPFFVLEYINTFFCRKVFQCAWQQGLWWVQERLLTQCFHRYRHLHHHLGQGRLSTNLQLFHVLILTICIWWGIAVSVLILHLCSLVHTSLHTYSNLITLRFHNRPTGVYIMKIGMGGGAGEKNG